MIFYSTVAIVIGVMFFVVGLVYLFKKDKMRNRYSTKMIANVDKYIVFSGVAMLVTGLLLLVSGICSFVIDKDLVFAIIFTALIVAFFVSDFICQKKFIKKNN